MSFRLSHARRGATLIFVLMALIALLAIGVVLLSRLRHKDPVPEAPATTATIPAESPASPADSHTSTPVDNSSPDADAAPMVTPPPPPPPLPPAAADPKSLPPEG